MGGSRRMKQSSGRACEPCLRTAMGCGELLNTGGNVVDFKKLSAERRQEAPTDPFKIFQRLPKPPHINDLWESQSEALKLWAKRRTERDLVIKLNTGGGKTLVGLLIGRALLNELRRPVLYLCPTRQLVQQSAEKAAEINLEAVVYETGPGDLPASFLNGKSILIATYSA